MPIRAYAAMRAGAPLEPFEYDPGPLLPEQVEISVEHCGLCHSDLSMIDSEWGSGRYPLVAGHEVVGVVESAGPQVKNLKVGDRVGLGWFSSSCTGCDRCLAGDHNWCRTVEQTIVGRHGGFADRVRAHWVWATPLPETLDATTAGPLFCGGSTVFNPLVQFAIKPTDRVAVVGIGGLGHLALKFLRAWGCEVTAFTSSESKHAEALSLGAHRAVATGDRDFLMRSARSFDLILVTVNVALEWPLFLQAVAPRGRLHFVGAVMEPISTGAFGLISGQKSMSGSGLGSPSTTAKMLEFCARHAIAPQVESFPMSRVNDAIEHLRSGKARYRVVLRN